MGNILNIYGTDVVIPQPQEGDYVENWGFPDNPSEQYWRRKGLPSFFDEVEYDKDGNALLDKVQSDYAREEVRRCKEGFWFLNNGVETYITGKNYFYLNFWKLEDDIYPDYRDLDRRYFLFLNHWEKTPWCLGIVVGKKRRQGATSIATSNLVYESIFFRNSFCGLTSKTQIDAKSAFTNMVSFGYRQLPVFLKPKQLNNKDSVSELVFAHKSVEVRGTKGAVIDTDSGHRSRIDYRAPSLNTYDSGRLSRGLFDEGAKWPKEVPFSTFISIVSKTLVKGVKRVGFIECPSTTNAMDKGGSEFKVVWEDANQHKHQRTPNRLVKYMTPAYDGYLGFIDKYGYSVIDPPTEEQYKFLVENFVGIGDLTEEDIKLGAKQYLLEKRKLLSGESLEEEIRMNPFDEAEMFKFAGGGSLYDSIKLSNQLEFLKYNEGLVEKGDLIWEDGHEFYKEVKDENGEVIGYVPNKLRWVSNPNGKFEKVAGWQPQNPNGVMLKNGLYIPTNTHLIRIGCDPFKFDKTKDSRRSNCAAYAYQLEDLANPEYAYNDTFVMRYSDMASTTDIQYYHVLKMAWYCGTKVLFERNVNNWKSFFREKKCPNFCALLPGELEPGIYVTGTGKEVQQICDYTQAYIEQHIEKVYFPELLGDESGWLGFQVENTQKYDDAMGAGHTLIYAKSRRIFNNQNSKKGIEQIFPYRQLN